MLTIDRKLVLRYMGYRGNLPDEAVSKLIDDVEAQLRKVARPAVVWRLFDVCRNKEELKLSGCNFALTGRHIAKHLEGCNRAAIICSTLSAEADRFIKRQELSDPLKGLAADALASAYVEAVSDNAKEDMMKEFPNCTSNFVFGAGYGDFPLDIVPRLLSAVDAGRKIGVSLTASGMIVPCKTIVGVTGIREGSPEPKLHNKCESCTMRDNCSMREK